MNWRWWRRKDNGHEAAEAERRAELQYRWARLQGLRVDRAIDQAQEVIHQTDSLAAEMQRAMRPRGT